MKKFYLFSALAFGIWGQAQNYTNGYFMINEGQFGSANGSLNFIDNTDQIIYRPYATENSNGAFGATAQFGTVYGGKLFVVSKQASDNDATYSAGGRLVVADAVTLKKLKGFNEIDGKDGRSFLGVDEKTGYIGTSNGIYVFDIENLTIGALISGTDVVVDASPDPYKTLNQIGNMIRTSQYVFAIKQDLGIYVINPKTHQIVQTISGSFNSIVQAKDGSVWAIKSNQLVNIDPMTFAQTNYAIPTKKYDGSWGAWNAGPFTASIKENSLYFFPIDGWSTSNTLVKFDVTSKSFDENYLTVPSSAGDIYGAGIRINPQTQDFIITPNEFYYTDRIIRFNKEKVQQSLLTVSGNGWYQSMPVFPDVNAPIVNSAFPTETVLTGVVAIDLKNVVSDDDNLSLAIVKSIKSNSNTSAIQAEINSNDELVLTPINAGTANVVISFNSNGRVVEKTISVSSSSLATGEIKKLQLSIYPNPTADILNIKTQDKLVEVSIFDISGRQINVKINNGQVDVNALQKGNYILKVVTEKAVYQEKFIKK